MPPLADWDNKNIGWIALKFLAWVLPAPTPGRRTVHFIRVWRTVFNGQAGGLLDPGLHLPCKNMIE